MSKNVAPNPSLAPVSEEVVAALKFLQRFTLDDIADCVVKNDDISIALTDAILAAVTLARASQAALKGGGRDEVIEECAKVASDRRQKWHAEARLHVNDAGGDVPPAWLRFKTKAVEAAEIADAIRSLKSPPGVSRGE